MPNGQKLQAEPGDLNYATFFKELFLSLCSVSLSVRDGSIETEILSQMAMKSEAANHHLVLQ